MKATEVLPSHGREAPSRSDPPRGWRSPLRQAGVVAVRRAFHLWSGRPQAFNGDATSDLDYETFALAAPGFGGAPRTEFCKTGRRPYDLAVAAVLLRCHLLLPDGFVIGSDGEWEHEWLTGAVPDTAGPMAGIGARRLLADLFGDTPKDNPFRPAISSPGRD